ncbi:MAG: TonB-dependent receptor plug domain-containing protein, partial [Puniceicoccales bacterium]|nr:TonB-dependent receptor plug domain-containing protein [Puniceicoccales bacterium]
MNKDSSPIACARLVRTQTGRFFARQTLRAAALPLLLLGVAPLLHAQSAATSTAPTPPTAEPAPTRLDPVVVVASRAPELLSTVSPSVSYIGADQLAAAGNYTVADALREQPGIYVLGNAFGNTASVFTRGVESRWTQFTLDGRRLNPGFSGFDSGLFTTGNLASVQIARGASSTFHGANAAGGVVDLRTVDPLLFEKPTGSISGEAGSYGYWRGAFEYGAASD